MLNGLSDHRQLLKCNKHLIATRPGVEPTSSLSYV